MIKEEVCCPFDNGFCAVKETALRKYEQAQSDRMQRTVNRDLCGHCPQGIQERARCGRYITYLENQKQR